MKAHLEVPVANSPGAQGPHQGSFWESPGRFRGRGRGSWGREWPGLICSTAANNCRLCIAAENAMMGWRNPQVSSGSRRDLNGSLLGSLTQLWNKVQVQGTLKPARVQFWACPPVCTHPAHRTQGSLVTGCLLQWLSFWGEGVAFLQYPLRTRALQPPVPGPAWPIRVYHPLGFISPLFQQGQSEWVSAPGEPLCARGGPKGGQAEALANPRQKANIPVCRGSIAGCKLEFRLLKLTQKWQSGLVCAPKPLLSCSPSPNPSTLTSRGNQL